MGRQELAARASAAAAHKLSRFGSWLAAAALAAALASINAQAAPSPTPVPSPAVEQLLAPPPSGFQLDTGASLRGDITASDFAASYGNTVEGVIEPDLVNAGFIAGYTQEWLNSPTTQAIDELAFAFTGGKGAREWLTEFQLLEIGYSDYEHADSLPGIDAYFGAHFHNTTTSAFTDEFGFVKGNNVFFVGVLSKKDDALPVARTQATQQYQMAPASTIPPAQWPENAKPPSAASSSNLLLSDAAFLGGGLLGGILLSGLVVLIVALARRPPAPTMPMVQQSFPASQQSMQPSQFSVQAGQISADGRYWWDGQRWHDTQQEAPPSAQRSPDGSHWWDGRNWRPVPQPPPGVSGL